LFKLLFFFIQEINLLLRNKQEELSEMNVRKEMAEKKLANLARENEVASEKLTVTFNLFEFLRSL